MAVPQDIELGEGRKLRCAAIILCLAHVQKQPHILQYVFKCNASFSGAVKFRIRIERGRPFIGVAAAKENISSLLDPRNTANLEQQVASAKVPTVAAQKHALRATVDADVDVENVLMRLSSSSVDQPEGANDSADCMAILRSFQVGSASKSAFRMLGKIIDLLL
jgi:hypothetical protein